MTLLGTSEKVCIVLVLMAFSSASCTTIHRVFVGRPCPPPAPTCVLVATPSTVSRGEPVRLVVTPTTPGYPLSDITYDFGWAVKDSQGRMISVTGTGARVEVPTGSLSCGTYWVTSVITCQIAGKFPAHCVTTGTATCSSTFLVNEPPCPIVACSISGGDVEVRPGERVTLRASGVGEGNLTYSWSITGGTLSSTTGSEVSLDTTGVIGTIRVTVNVATDRTHCGEACPGSSCTTTITVVQLPPPSYQPIPIFHFPPPVYTTNLDIGIETLKKPRGETRLRDIAAKLQTALNDAGYSDISWYAAPGGFAIVTRLEQFRVGGNYEADEVRFADNVPERELHGPLDFVKDMVLPNPGRWRVIVLLVSNQPTTQGAPITSDEARAWFTEGLNRFPESLGEQALKEDYYCQGLVYVFVKRSATDHMRFRPSYPLNPEDHLRRILRALRRQL